MQETPLPEEIAPKPAIKPVEPQLPIIEHKMFRVFDKARADWGRLSGQGKVDATEKAKSLIEGQTTWWQDRPRKVKNNAYSWTNANFLSAALLLDKSGDKEKARQTIEQAKNGFFTQVRTNVYPDGSSLDFHDRDAIHYHVFNEFAWLKSAGYLREAGVEIPSDVTEKLELSIQFVEPYLKGYKTHTEFASTTNPRDKARDEKRPPEKRRFGKPFNPKDSVYSRTLAEEIAKFRARQPN